MSGAVLSTPSAQTITITDNDGAGGGTGGVFQFATTNSYVTENAGYGTLTINVLRIGESSGRMGVLVSQIYPDLPLPNAVAGQDFTGTLPLALTFEDGETSKSVALTIVDDNEVETNERLRLALSPLDGGAVLGLATLHDIIISSDDLPPTYVPQKASYTGLLNESFARPGYGSISFITTATGALTGKIMADGVTYPFSGKLDSIGQFRGTFLVRANGQTYDRFLFLRIFEGADRFDGTFGIHAIAGERNAVGTRNAPVVGTGKYTALLREDDETMGALTLNLGATGGAKYLGWMGDGTAFSGATALSQTGRLPICAGMYTGKKGFVFGPGQLAASGQPRAYLADLVWSKPAPVTPAGVFPNGFASRFLDLDGAAFTPALKGIRLLPALTTANVHFTGGDLSPPIGPIPIGITEKNKFSVPATAQKLTLLLTPATGAFTGTFKHNDGKLRRMRGVVVQQKPEDGPGILEGTFPGINLSGEVEISAP
jgi:hypothetical protein